MLRSRLLHVIALVAACCVVLPDGARADASWTWPLGDRRVATTFRAPPEPYASGHRGVDLPGSVGDAVRSVAAGRVTFAGRVAGIPVITVTHGAERSTYQPVRARVRVGDAVERGQRIGWLVGTPSHCATACLHLGRLEGRQYLDPLEVLGGVRGARLVDPEGPPPRPPASGTGELLRPVGGPVTSPFGMRVHPVTGVRKLHDGTDFAAPCGTPVLAAADGIVQRVGTVGGYGQRVVIEHAAGAATLYGHLSAYEVVVGRRVRAGDVVGRVGRTGYATGCHLHLTLVEDGRPVDPLPRL